jgi:hypothetical protein
MTIRENITRKWFTSLGIGAVAMVGLMVALAVGDALGCSRQVETVAVVAFFCIAMAIAAFQSLCIRCPRCRGNLLPLAVPPMFSRHKVKWCPYCAVSLDEECSSAKNGSPYMKN